MIKRFTLLAATGFGLGYSPVASGTVGTLIGVPMAWALAQAGVAWHAVGAIGLILLALPICDCAEKHFGTKDDGRIVADEYLTFPLCTIGLPLDPWVLALAFLSHRIFDILKPPPANQLQSLHGGVGIVIDDVISTLYALVANMIAVRVLFHFFF